MRQRWRRFRARLRPGTRVAKTDFLSRSRLRLETLLPRMGGSRQVTAERLERAIEAQAQRVRQYPEAVEWFVLLLLRTPGAARAQTQMDKHPHAGTGQQARLFELIDFNDTFVSTVLALTPAERVGFIELAQAEMARFCKRTGARMFSDEQYEAITRGLTREIAVYLGAVTEGFRATMTSRSQDAMGVDMVITDPSTGQSVNIDCKTSSAYRYRLLDLVREGRLSQTEADQADVDGYVHGINGHGEDAVAVTILRIDANELGDIKDFQFTQPSLLGKRLHLLVAKNVQKGY